MRLLAGSRAAPWRFLEPSHLDTPRVTSHAGGSGNGGNHGGQRTLDAAAGGLDLG